MCVRRRVPPWPPSGPRQPPKTFLIHPHTRPWSRPLALPYPHDRVGAYGRPRDATKDALSVA